MSLGMNEATDSKDRYLTFTLKVLKKVGNTKPTKKQIAFMEDLIFTIGIEHKLLFDQKLTQTEIGCLRLIAMGKSAQDIANHLTIKKTTVDSHYKNIKKKLACKTMAQAVFEGLRFGYLTQKKIANE